MKWVITVLLCWKSLCTSSDFNIYIKLFYLVSFPEKTKTKKHLKYMYKNKWQQTQDFIQIHIPESSLLCLSWSIQLPPESVTAQQWHPADASTTPSLQPAKRKWNWMCSSSFHCITSPFFNVHLKTHNIPPHPFFLLSFHNTLIFLRPKPQSCRLLFTCLSLPSYNNYVLVPLLSSALSRPSTFTLFHAHSHVFSCCSVEVVRCFIKTESTKWY